MSCSTPRSSASVGGTDERYEGRLSFLDGRSMVPRLLRLEVEHTGLNGTASVTVFTDSLARLVSHEVDHLLSGAAVVRGPVFAG
ncbi:peptide deformylase [Nonomuraea basaltis]|uniref:peptide deformylase n=1 Tax=Nonomuraea basaltis TaxID=2495887 RepID=UPI00110C4507|nr:hypothetical protein EJK15_64525 [Nonomuraea basaltis]